MENMICEKCGKPLKTKVEFQGKEHIVNCICDCNKYEIENQQKSDNDLVQLTLTKSEAKNLKDFIKYDFIPSIRKDEGIDNIEYVCDICRAYRKLKYKIGD